MGSYTQANRPIQVTTPLGKDALLLVGFTGQEALSHLFSFQLDLIAENKVEVAFDKLLGQSVTVQLELPGGKGKRYFNGVCNRVSQGLRDNTFTSYRLEIVPKFWLLTKKAQSRIFQHLNVPDILKKVFTGLNVTYELQGTFPERDYCVQYRETDFNFASRLMEEEGIYYFFKHADGNHTMVVANTPGSHAAVPGPSKITFEGNEGARWTDDRVHDWEKLQELRSGKYTLWDHTFELPHKHLEADKTIQDSVAVGKVTHPMKLAANAALEVYDYPGEYAQRFDGVDKGGGDRPADVQKIFGDNTRTVGIRMQEEGQPGILIHATSTCRQMVSGHKFSLEKHFNADGDYVLTSVHHTAEDSSYRSSGGSFNYHNSFTCIPLGLPFRPPRTTPKPFVQGTQTAVVVGPPGEEIFTDKYGRIKVQFHWDREGKYNADSSCWVRVAQPWAGKNWGTFFLPRIGQEVVVAFQEGDPDQPICVGSVYNADQMPPYLGKGPDPKHPHDPKLTGIKSNTTMGGVGFNEWRFDDTKGKEQIWVHAERNMDQRVKNDSMELVIHDRHLIVGAEKDGKKDGDQREMVYQDKHLHVHRHHVEHIEGNMELLVGHGSAKDGGNQDIVIEKDKKELIEGNDHRHVNKDRKAMVDGNQDLTVGKDNKELIQGNDHFHVNKNRNAQVDGNQDLTVGKDNKELIQGNDHFHVNKDRFAKVDGNQDLVTGGNRKEVVQGAYHLGISGNRNEQVGGTRSLNVGKDLQTKVGSNHALEAVKEIHLKAGMKVIIEAGMQLTIKGPGGFVDIGPAGVTIQGTLVKINSGGSAGSGSGATVTKPDDAQNPTDAQAPQDAEAPKDAKQAKPIVPTLADNAVSGKKSAS